MFDELIAAVTGGPGQQSGDEELLQRAQVPIDVPEAGDVSMILLNIHERKTGELAG
jgi:hypothetical protein